ncbi:MAG: hypothetical protein NVSMB62_17020 [Acidobacteriaceae bacterium]
MKRTYIDWQEERSETLQLSRSAGVSDESDGAARAILLGESLAVRRLRSQVERIAPYFRKALVRGDAGSGKRLIAELLHTMSPAAGPFVTCRAASLAEVLAQNASAPEVATLLDSARGGTLYVEEIGEVPYGLQTGLLRFFAEQSGGLSLRLESAQAAAPTRAQRGVRVISGTARDLRTMCSIGQFRPDLYAQISVVELFAPALRQRAEDLPLLAEWSLERLSRRTGLPQKVLSSAALSELSGRVWSNNLRELETVVTHAAALAEGPVIELWHLAPPAKGPLEAAPRQVVSGSAERLQDVIHEHVVQVLTRCGGNKLRAAELLGISRSTLYRMLDAGAGSSIA